MFSPTSSRKAGYLRILFALALAMLGCRGTAQDAHKSHRKILVTIQPEYPQIIQNARFEGQVRLEATVLANGTVTRVDVRGGNPILAEYASKAVMQWKYAPALVETVEEVTFSFHTTKH
jgi:TonB family protein